MRAGTSGDAAAVQGIERAGSAEADPAGRLAPGTRVVALLGGMGRTRNGSYPELVTVPATTVAVVNPSPGWAEPAAIPEVYARAWNGLFGNLDPHPGERVLVRGATSSLGRAAVNLAVAHGARVLATTRAPAHAPLLKGLGAEEVLIDDGHLAAQVRRGSHEAVDAVFDLVGNNVLRDSPATVRPRGRVCQLGFLGGSEPVRQGRVRGAAGKAGPGLPCRRHRRSPPDYGSG
ncbi:zinc-binding dehydrogenase [Streptomyces sp. NPDC004667]|uniref:zinc-binding dehydrogenase n=1 Tax=Streptomyces sp. NPDC004667 TaxID=3154285 RepID=UPI0033BCB9D7